MDSLKSPYTTSYRSEIETIALNCLVFEKNHIFLYGFLKIAFLCMDFGNGQIDKQMDSSDV